jgi:hypothetical protein
MPYQTIAAALILAASLLTAQAADHCPADGADAIVVALKQAPSCNRAMAMFEACQTGASGDVQFGAAVTTRCEVDFLRHLSRPRKSAYQHDLRVCDRKYSSEGGSMYRSFEAFCQAGVAQRYSRRAIKIAAPAK